MADHELLRELLVLGYTERAQAIRKLSSEERREIGHYWKLWARRSQIAPPGDWRVWLISAGRGFGKTRAGAEWVRMLAQHNVDFRIALVGASLTEVRQVMVEGESGILAVCPPENYPLFEPSLRRLTWGNGAQAFLYSAAEFDTLRGPQHHVAWCDEVGKWENAGDRAIKAWDNLLLGLRLGERPRVLATTTPRPVALLRRLYAAEAGGEVAIVRGASAENQDNLPARYLKDMRRQYGSTAIGRQELDGELLEDIEGALWSRELLERCRAAPGETALPEEPNQRVVVGVDPPVSARGDECGIVVAGIAASGRVTVLADCSIARPSPERWARQVAETARNWSADRVIAEANQGGDMVQSVLRAADIALPVRLVHASRGKAARGPINAGNVSPKGFDFDALALALDFRPAMVPVSPGDVLLVRPGPAQHHLLVAGFGTRLIHAHAGLRRIVATPGPPQWPLLRHWRFPEDLD